MPLSVSRTHCASKTHPLKAPLPSANHIVMAPNIMVEYNGVNQTKEVSMEITSTTHEGTTTIALSGWLDTGTAPSLANAIEEIGPDCTALVLDFDKLEYISSAGLRALVAAHKKMNGNLTIEHVSPEVMQVLRMTGIGKRLNIE